MDFRTDLALERREMIKTDIPGVNVRKNENDECHTTIIEITDEKAAKRLGKGVGRYITLEMSPFSDEAPVTDGRLDSLVKSIRSLLPAGKGTVLVAGVGNPELTADALGPMTASHIFATRHIDENLEQKTGLGSLRPVAAVSTGVLGKTGIESSEYIESICKAVKPACVVTIDALAAGSVSRLGNTVQMSDTGIAPGSGIGNARKRIDEKSIGVPVIAIGVPTVVDAISLTAEISGIAKDKIKGEFDTDNLIVAPKDIDLITKNASYILALALNCALQPTLTPEEIYGLM
ncbi:MAG: GPR endopeptidase [Ruminococcaceae bacterium]|nr:GPR endopeptidase [Oscillospiraceae bacterium]